MDCKIALLLASALCGAPLHAQQEPRMRTAFGVGAPTMYFFRGIMQQNGGLILQPSLEIERRDMRVAQLPFRWRFGTWNSLHEGQTGTSAAGTNAAWYESQFYGGCSLGVTEELVLTTTYAALTSPNGGGFRVDNPRARTTQELRLRADWDDGAGMTGGTLRGLHPYSELVFELAGGRDAGRNLGTYLEVGVAPRLAATADVAVTMPVRVGLSLRDYYEDATGDDDFFGYLSVGLRAALPLGSKDSLFGPWQLAGFVDAMVLGDNLEQFNNRDGFDLFAGLHLQLTW